jgi:membrane glycosyltransferase
MVYVPFKTNELSKKIISIGIMFFLVVFKVCYIPVFISPMKSVIKYEIPGGEIIITILTYLNVSFSIIPLFLFTYTLLLKHFKFYNNGILTYERDKIINIIMPIYNEKPQPLLNAIESVKKLHYPKELIHLYLSFDEGTIGLFLLFYQPR